MVTIKQVAEYAGVSVATISRVLNNPDKVKEDTKKRVYAAIEFLDYAPNLLGRNLRVAHTKTILVLLPTIANDFYSSIMTGIRESAQEDGYHIMIGVTDHEAHSEKGYMNLLQTRSVDGVILLSSKLDQAYLGNMARHYPIVQCCEYIEGVDISLVTIDNYQAAYDATKYLIELGHKRIGFIGGEEDYISARLRAKGFWDALEASGLMLSKDYMTLSNYSYKSGVKGCERLMALKEPPTAIFTVADSIAVGVIKKAQELGLKIGKDLDIIGFDDTAIARMYNPAITTVSQPRVELGSRAYELLKKKIEDLSSQVERVYLRHTIKVRETTK
ncbi:MAG: LacI family DNA-binding transcriptional regulator [Cellulosilyticaceae bacterium]